MIPATLHHLQALLPLRQRLVFHVLTRHAHTKTAATHLARSISGAATERVGRDQGLEARIQAGMIVEKEKPLGWVAEKHIVLRGGIRVEDPGQTGILDLQFEEEVDGGEGVADGRGHLLGQ